jgi:hypothetical protein
MNGLEIPFLHGSQRKVNFLGRECGGNPFYLGYSSEITTEISNHVGEREKNYLILVTYVNKYKPVSS